MIANSSECTEDIFKTVLLLSIHPNEVKLCSHQSLYTGIFSSFTCSLPKLETTQVSINWWMDKQTLGHPYSGILLNNTKEQVADSCKNIG